MLHYIKLCLWGATISLMLSLNSIMSMVALWSATCATMPKVRVSKLGRTNSIFDKLNLKSFRSWWKWKIGGKLVTHDDATPPALVAVVSYQFTTDLPLPSTLEPFKCNLSKIDIVFLSDFDRGPRFERRSFGMAARVANHKTTVDMIELRESMSRMAAPLKHSFM
jgi:hypothetical protein